ncbi:MAG TPA: Calx-beta domain-containing protein [Abditibacteriaceae bacterium]|jgi:Tol biopolymer transport system component
MKKIFTIAFMPAERIVPFLVTFMALLLILIQPAKSAGDVPIVSIGNVSVIEGNSATTIAVFPVNLSSASTQDVTVDYATFSNMATAESDFISASGTLTIPAGQTAAFINVSVKGDVSVEQDELIRVTLSNAHNAVMGRVTALATIVNDDPPSLTIADVTLLEGQNGITEAVFVVNISDWVNQSSSVDYTVMSGTAAAGSDYVATTGTLNIPAERFSVTIAIPVRGDGTPEASETFSIHLSNPVNARIADEKATATIVNDDGLSVKPAQLKEGNSGMAAAIFYVSLTSPVAQDVEVDYSTGDYTAHKGSDYFAKSGTLLIPAGRTVASITVAVRGDTILEANESFFINLSNPKNTTLINTSASATIINDETGGLGKIVFDTNRHTLTPTDNNYEIYIMNDDGSEQTRLTNNTYFDGNPSVNANTGKIAFESWREENYGIYIMDIDGSNQTQLTNNQEYAGDPSFSPDGSKITFVSMRDGNGEIYVMNADGSNQIRLTYHPAVDLAPSFSPDGSKIIFSSRRNGRFLLYFMNADGSDPLPFMQAGEAAFAPCLSPDGRRIAFLSGYDDQAEIFTINRDGTGLSQLTNTAGRDRRACFSPDGSRIVFESNRDGNHEIYVMNADGGEQKALTKHPGFDLRPSWAFVLPPVNISVAAATRLEGNSGITNIQVPVTLSRASEHPVTVNYATAVGTAYEGSDYLKTVGTLTFRPGETVKTISVPLIGDSLYEANESFFILLSNANGAAILNAQGRAAILNDDSPTLTINDVTVTESDAANQNATFTVTIPAPATQDISVKYVTANGSALSAKDYAAHGGTLTIPVGHSSASINVPILVDTLDEADELFYVILSSPVGAAIARGRGIGTIGDNDVAPSITVDNVTVVEGNSGARYATFALRLSSPSGQVVRVIVQSANGSAEAGSDYTPLPSTVVSFTTGVRAAVARILVQGDVIDEPNETFVLNLSNPVNATITDNQGQALISDDDATPSLSINDASLLEGNDGTKTLNFTVTRSGQSAQNIMVNYATANGIARSGSDYVAKSGTIGFAPGGPATQSISITINGDAVIEGDERFYVLLSGANNAATGRGRGIGTIQDDEQDDDSSG